MKLLLFCLNARNNAFPKMFCRFDYVLARRLPIEHRVDYFFVRGGTSHPLKGFVGGECVWNEGVRKLPNGKMVGASDFLVSEAGYL